MVLLQPHRRCSASRCRGGIALSLQSQGALHAPPITVRESTCQLAIRGLLRAALNANIVACSISERRTSQISKPHNAVLKGAGQHFGAYSITSCCLLMPGIKSAAGV